MNAQRKPSLLVLSSLYPNSVQPRHGIFVEERLRKLIATEAVTARVVAPVPWFPFRNPRFGRYADFAAVPAREVRYGIEVLHPRYLVIPRVGMTLGPLSMAAAVAPLLRRLLAAGEQFDLIDAHYFYPDGVAGVRLGQRFQLPVVVTARGTDINLISSLRMPRRQIVAAARQAAALVTVSEALREALLALGADAKKTITLRNGVDLQRFAPIAQQEARAALACVPAPDQPVWLAVGHLVKGKGVHITLKALSQALDVTLLVVGTGPEEQPLRDLAVDYSVAERVHFLGHVEHDELPTYFSAADALVLPTASEGMPNVVLEAMACGTAVIATAVGGIPEVVADATAGVLMRERSATALLDAWHAVQTQGLDEARRNARRAYAERFGWTETTRDQLQLFRQILGEAHMPAVEAAAETHVAEPIVEPVNREGE
ncbi:MAG TPA: glycosyltransferase [Salinisphaeraceae bacterium]|nr:glycosyltransferase [Salinisphaeraceae bacterium]